jgi:hypothetical protein
MGLLDVVREKDEGITENVCNVNGGGDGGGGGARAS